MMFFCLPVEKNEEGKHLPCKVEKNSEEMKLQSPSVVDLIRVIFTLAELWYLEEPTRSMIVKTHDEVK